MKLTKKSLDAATYKGPEPRQDIRYDDEVPGFGVRLFPSGTKSFVLRYRNGKGRSRMLTLGRYGPMTLAQGRQLARDRYLEVRAGSDPQKEARAAHSSTGTVAGLLEMYLERYAKKHRRSWREDQRRIHKRLLPAVGSRDLENVSRSDIHQLHDAISGDGGPVEANRCIEVLRGAWNWGLELELLSVPNPATASRTRRYTWKAKEKSRERVLTKAEMARLVGAIKAEPNPWAAGAMWLGLLTALRRSDVLGLAWSDIDVETRTLSIVTSKDQVRRTFPLSVLAWSKLRDIPQQAGVDWVICSTRQGERLQSIKTPWNRVRAAADLTDIGFHDLRRTCASWLASAGESDRIIKAVLGHSDQSATGVYARVSPEAVRSALDRYADLVGATVDDRMKPE